MVRKKLAHPLVGNADTIHTFAQHFVRDAGVGILLLDERGNPTGGGRIQHGAARVPPYPHHHIRPELPDQTISFHHARHHL